MTFLSPDQIAELKKPLDRKHVSSRSQAGRDLSYIESWFAISEANRIFGHGAWNRETSIQMIGQPREVGDKWRVEYLAKVRITVGDIIRDGCGFGQGIDKDVGQAHESALKEAESDAMKRALMTFGNPFGLALYDKSQSNVVDIVETINDAQQAELQVLIEQSGMGSAKFLSSYGIEKLSDLPEKKFAPAGKRLREIIHENTTKKEAA